MNNLYQVPTIGHWQILELQDWLQRIACAISHLYDNPQPPDAAWPGLGRGWGSVTRDPKQEHAGKNLSDAAGEDTDYKKIIGSIFVALLLAAKESSFDELSDDETMRAFLRLNIEANTEQNEADNEKIEALSRLRQQAISNAQQELINAQKDLEKLEEDEMSTGLKIVLVLVNVFDALDELFD